MSTTMKLKMLLLTLLPPVTASALQPYNYVNYEFEVDGIYYMIENGNACVTYQNYTNGMHLSDYQGDVVIPSTVTYEGETYPVTIIDYYAFNYCVCLTSITIPASITTIRNSAFCQCTGLTRVTITDLEAWCKCNILGIDSNPLRYAQHLYLNDTEVTDLMIPDGITSVGNYAFLGWTALTSVRIPNSVSSIGDNAFNGCTGLTSIYIPNSVTEIGQVAFEGCTALKSVTLGNAITTIGLSAFSGCTALTSITIPNSVTDIGASAFSGCTSLLNATLGNAVAHIGGGAFWNCSALMSIKIPNSVTDIGINAFNGCTELSSVTIGNSVTTIGKNAFQNAPSIETVTCKSTTPPSWSDQSMFTTNVYNHAELHVLKNAERAYETNLYWGQFLTIIGDASEDNPPPGDVNGDGEINISDAEGVIDIVVMGGNGGHTREPAYEGEIVGDVNGDGETNIMDVDAIIKIILGQ